MRLAERFRSCGVFCANGFPRACSSHGLAFTGGKDTLLDQLERRSWTRDALGTAAPVAIDPALRETGIGKVEDYKSNLVEDQFGRAKLYRYLELVGALARYPGRKSVALFSSGYPLGFDYSSETFANTQEGDLLEALRGEATRGRVRLYAVDIGGLTALARESDAGAGSLAPETEGAFRGGRGGTLGTSDSRFLLQNGLAVIANQTGGEAILNENNLDRVFDPVLRDESGFYLLTYAIPEAAGGAGREIEVRVRREGLRLDYQRRYSDRESFEVALREGRGIPAAAGGSSDSFRTAFREYGLALASLESGEGGIESAIAALERATAAEPRFAPAWSLLGNLRASSGRAEEAREAFEKGIAADPDLIGPYRGLIELASAEADWTRVREQAARLLARRGDDAGGLYAAALAEWNLENVKAAKEAAQRAVDAGAASEFPRVHKVMGLALASAGDLSGAAAELEAYIGLSPRASDAGEVRAKAAEWRSTERLEQLRTLADEGRWREAAELSSELLAAGERLTEAHFFHGLAQFNLGRSNLALQHARLAAEGDRAATLPEIRYLLGLLAAHSGDTRTAAAVYRAYLEAKPASEMADEIRARVAEWEWDRQAEPSGPATTLDAVKAHVRRTLNEVPNYACAIVMERGEMSPHTGREHARALARAEREGKATPEPVYDRGDRIRLDVAMIGGRELFSWPGESAFSERPLAETIGYGAASTGDYALHARNVFLEQNTTFRASGRETVDGRETERYAFSVPLEESRFAVQQDGEPTVVAYEGSVWAAGADLAAMELLVKTFPRDYGIEWSRTRIEYQTVELGRTSFQLPHVSDSTIRFRSGARNALRVTFRDCRSYGADSAITFGDAGPSSAEPAQAPVEIRLPVNLGVSVRLTSAIRSDAMVGDPIEGVLENALLIGLETAFSPGARVTGRIRRLDYLTDPAPHHVLGIELTRVESEGRFAKLSAEMVGVAGLAGYITIAATVEGMRPWRSLGGGEAWKMFFRGWDGGHRTGGSAVYYERFLARVGLLFLHGREFELAPGLSTRWVTVGAP